MTNSLKDQAVKRLKDKHDAEVRAAEVNNDKGALKTIQDSQKRVQQKQQGKTSPFEFDKLQLYLGEPFVVNDKITILQPTVGEMIRLGEKKVYSVIHIFRKP